MRIFVAILVFVCSLNTYAQSARQLWTSLNDKDLSFEALRYALGALHMIDTLNDTIITIIDFTLPSTQKRLWVINLKKPEVLIKTYVAHGRNTGENWALHFGNLPNSNMSSPGFFITGNTYYGRHGYSLNLVGIEPGINDNALRRRIVLHGAWYVSEDFIKKYGRLGRSNGCPAVPEDQASRVIDYIKDGTLLFIYTNDESYFRKSKIINRLTAN